MTKQLKSLDKILVTPDNGQICIGKKYAGETFKVSFLEDGQILLTPGKFTPANHATFFTPDAIKTLKAFDKHTKTRTEPSQDAEVTLQNVIKKQEKKVARVRAEPTEIAKHKKKSCKNKKSVSESRMMR